jgi:hypothetical protein
MTAFYELGIHRRRDERDEVWHRSESAQYFDANEFLSPEEAVRRTAADKMEYVVSDSATMNFKGGFTLEIPNKYGVAIFNAPWVDGGEPVALNRTVGNRYVPFQNLELANILDSLSKEWPLEGFMILKEGEIVVFQLKINEHNVGNKKSEKILNYLTLANGTLFLDTTPSGRGLHTALRIAPGPYRPGLPGT